MLNFFRKYQRYFFIFIVIVIVISFSFFGAHQTITQPQQIDDRCIGQIVDGSKMMKNEIDRMVRFIWSDRNDVALIEKGIMPNFFNDGVIRKDLMETGVGTFLVNAYFDELKEELQQKVELHRHFRPYVHPSAPFISMKNLWEQIFPVQKMNLERFLDETQEITPEVFSLLVDLYLGETAFPSNILREYLMFQEKHCDWIRPDPALPRANLNLFQCRSIEDWFGFRFLQLSAQFIINAAAYAKEQGYQVSYEEAHVDLIRKGYDSLRMQMHKSDVTQEEVGNFWQQQLRNLETGEKEAVFLWQKVMLFRRLFEDIGGAVFVDPHVYRIFYGFASKAAKIDFYHLPETLELKDFSSLMKLEYYLDQVSKNRRNGLMLPQDFSSIDEIEKNCPELVEQRVLVEVAEVKKDKIALNVSIKEMWEWQLEQENYRLLEKEFPQLALKKGVDAESYFIALEETDSNLRQKIDKFSRGKIIDRHPEWIEEALNQDHMITKQIGFSSNGETLSFGEKDLVDLFKVAALKGELEGNQVAIEARKKLEQYTSDGETYYRFHILDRDLNKAVLTFEEANKRGVIDSLLEQYLEYRYPQIRSKNPEIFQTKENEWKHLKDVKNELGVILYSEVLKEIDLELSKLGIRLSEERYQNLDDFYPKHRLYPYMTTIEQEIRRFGDASHVLQRNQEATTEGSLSERKDLRSQWMLIKEEKVFKNHEKKPCFSCDLFAMVEKSWSGIFLGRDGHPQFFRLKEKSVPNGDFSKEMKQGQELLAREAKQYFMNNFLKILKEKQAIRFNYDNPERT